MEEKLALAESMRRKPQNMKKLMANQKLAYKHFQDQIDELRAEVEKLKKPTKAKKEVKNERSRGTKETETE